MRGRLGTNRRGLFVILRTCKSRFGCGRHCPRSVSIFGPSGLASTGCRGGRCLVGTCSGAVHCASNFLTSLVALLRGAGSFSTVLCASSRKRSVFSSGQGLFLRTSPIPSCCRLRMPFLV